MPRPRNWWLVNSGDCENGYAYTYGNGPNPSAEGIFHSEQALTLFRAVGGRRGQADVLNDIGWDHAQPG